VPKVPHDFISTGHLPAINDAQPSQDSYETPELRGRTAQGRPRTGACRELLREIKSQRGGDRRLTERTLPVGRMHAAVEAGFFEHQRKTTPRFANVPKGRKFGMWQRRYDLCWGASSRRLSGEVGSIQNGEFAEMHKPGRGASGLRRTRPQNSKLVIQFEV
jgi:hypothetical protein